MKFNYITYNIKGNAKSFTTGKVFCYPTNVNIWK